MKNFSAIMKKLGIHMKYCEAVLLATHLMNQNFIFQKIHLNLIPIVMKTFFLEVSQFHFGMDNIFLFVFARLGLIQE